MARTDEEEKTKARHARNSFCIDPRVGRLAPETTARVRIQISFFESTASSTICCSCRAPSAKRRQSHPLALSSHSTPIQPYPSAGPSSVLPATNGQQLVKAANRPVLAVESLISARKYPLLSVPAVAGPSSSPHGSAAREAASPPPSPALTSPHSLALSNQYARP